MANRFPLVIDTTDGNKLKELPAGDNLDLRESSIVRVQNVDALGTINAADITVNGNRIVAQNFIDLTDTPANYTDAANKFVKVNATGDALEFRPFSDIGNIEVDEIEVAVQIVPETTGVVNIGTDELYFDRVVANEFKGDLISGTDERVFNAATGKLSYAALEGAPTQVSEFENDIGYLLAADLNESLAGLFDEGSTFATDITGSVFGDDSTMLVDGVGSQIVGVVNNTTVTTVNLTATTSTVTTSVAGEFKGSTTADTVLDAQNNYDIRIGENNTGNTIIFNGEANGFEFESGIGIAEYSAATDLIFRAGNRIRFTDTPVRFSQLTDTQAGYIVAQNGDVIYNTTQNRLQIRQNGAWVDLHKGLFDGNVSAITGESNFNDVVVAGNLTVEGTTTTIDTANTTIKDNIIVLNEGEVGAGITAGSSGIEIDRGLESNVTFVYNESIDKWTLGSQTLVAAAFEGNLDATTADVSGTLTAGGIVTGEIQRTDGGNIQLLAAAGGNLTLGGTTITVTASSTTISGSLTVDGDLQAAAFKGSVVGDDSTVIVDAVNNNLSANKLTVETVEGISGLILLSQGGINATATTSALLRSLGGNFVISASGGAVTLQSASGSADISVSDIDNSITLTATGTTTIEGAASAAINIGTGTSGTVTIGNGSNTIGFTSGTTVNFNGATINNFSGNVIGNIDNTTLNIGTSTATAINIGNENSAIVMDGTLQLNSALIVNNLVADDSISITTATGDGNAISLGPLGTNTAINLTADSIRFFGPITTSIAAQGGVVGDLKGSVVADDSTVLVDAVNGIIPKANIESSTNWDTAFGWGNHASAGYLTAIPSSITGDLKGSVFADDSSVMVNAVDFTMATDIMTLTPLNAPPADPISGMLAAADGTNWDPATKSGVVSYPVFYDGAAWNALY